MYKWIDKLYKSNIHSQAMMFLNRFRGLFAEALPTAVWWPSSPEGKAWDQRIVTVVPYTYEDNVSVFYYLKLYNKATIVLSMTTGDIFPELLSGDWVTLHSRYTGTLLIFSTHHQLGASLHTAHFVADSEGVSASMLWLHSHECQWSILPNLSGVVILYLPPIEEPGDSGGGAASNLHCQGDLLSLGTLHLTLVVHNGWWKGCVCIDNKAIIIAMFTDIYFLHKYFPICVWICVIKLPAL